MQREAHILSTRINYEPSRFLISHGRSMAAVTKSSTTSTEQLWRKTRKKVGPSMSKAAIQEAKKDLDEDLRDLKSASFLSNVSKPSDDEDFPKYNWVPPAYRGVVDENKPGNSVRKHRLEANQAKGMVRPRRMDKPITDRYILHSKDGVFDVPALGLPEHAVIVKQQTVKRIVRDILALSKAATSYRVRLCGGDPTTTDQNQDQFSLARSCRNFQPQIASALQSIHDEDVSVENSEQIDGSYLDFQSICQILQQICSSACHLSTLRKYNDQDAIVYADLAEYTLYGLVQINEDRLMLLGNNTKTTGKSKVNKTKNKSDNVVTGWFNQIVEGLTPSLLSTTSPPKQGGLDKNDAGKSIDAPTMQSMKRLLKHVLGVIASTAKKPEIPLVASLKPTNGMTAMADMSVPCIDEKLGDRMLTLLEKTWSLGVRDNDATKSVMEILAQIGTLESARRCHDVYEKHSFVDRHVSFSVVLEAYLEAIKRETDQGKVHDIVGEVMTIHSGIPWISHRTERILHACTILNCLAVADMGKVDGMCARAELIVKRALREKSFTFFVEELESEVPSVDSQLVPIANYLAQLYATSGQSVLMETSVKLLRYGMAASDGFCATTIYPTSDTCNAVLQTLVQSSSEKDVTSKQNDYTFARKILKYMFNKTDLGCTPNQTTYDCLFTLLEATNTDNIGVLGEDLLSYIETNNLLFVSSTFSLPITTYYRVLQCYLRMAKNSAATDEIDENHLPHRRAAHLLRKLEIRSTPMVLNSVVLAEIAVENLYLPQLRPYYSAYKVVMQICANTSQLQYQDEAADIALDIYRTRFQYDSKVADCWNTVLENCTNEKLVERVKQITDHQSI